MILRILSGLVAVASVLLVSCSPYQEHPKRGPKTGTKPAQLTAAQTEQAKRDAQQAEIKRAEDEKRMQAQAEQQAPDLTREPTDAPPETGNKPEPTKPLDYEYAKNAPGKDGFVLSPYNNKIIDVHDDAGKKRPRGTLVSDPTYPASEKKYFRVP
ncbi:MAG: hypothetical protein WCK77_00215 [Verrucomicrobiota bacterium]